MPLRLVLVAGLLSVVLLAGCNNTLNPFCGSARPAPLIGSLSPNTISFTDIEKGAVLTVKGSQFVASSVVLINGQALSTSVNSSQLLKVTLTSGIISGPGQVNVNVMTPSGGSGDVGCSSGGKSTTLALTVN
jgi:hypothetical protein